MLRSSRLKALRTPLVGAAAGVAVLSLLFHAAGGGSAAAADSVYAHAQLLDLKIEQVDPLGLETFSGSYGVAGTPPPESEDPGDFSDPDGVLDYVAIGGADSRTGRSAAKVYAETHSSGMTVQLNGIAFVDVENPGGLTGAVDTYAECIPEPYGPYAFAYARTDASLIRVVGHPVTVGTTVLTVTGAELNRPELGVSTLTVELTPYQVPDSGSAVAGLDSAEAGVDVSVDAVLNDLAGRQVYSGPVTHLEVGHVEVRCAADEPTMPPTTAPITTAAPTTTPPTTAPPTTEVPITTGPPPTTAVPTTSPPTTTPPPTTPPPPTTAVPTTTPPPTTPPPTTAAPTTSPPTTPPTSPTSPPEPTGTTSSPPGPEPSTSPPVPPNPTDDGSGGGSGGNSGGSNGGSGGGTGSGTTAGPNPPGPGGGLAASGARIAWATATGAGVLAAGVVLVVAVRRRNESDA